MNMESPVRICLGAALVVNILLLSNATVSGNVIPQNTTSTTVKEEITPKYNRTNPSWATRNKSKIPDVSLNELSPKESISEEHTEKNAKYKDRGRVRFNLLSKSSTESPIRRVRSSSEAAKLIIVTPTPEVKKPAAIIDSMRTYKKTKMPVKASSSTTPVAVKKEVHNVEEYEDQDEEEDEESFEKFTSNKFHDSNFFTIPSFEDGDDSENDSSNNNVKQDYSSPSYGFSSSFFPKDISYGHKDDAEPFKSIFSDFDTELTTPKNDFFDSRYQKISESIIKNLGTIKAKASPPNTTNIYKIHKENINLGPSNNTSSNKSSVFIKNTKKIRLSDNEGANSANTELSDVKGTSIYYEMSVLSTETYAIHSNDDDCDNDTLAFEPTASTSPEEELGTLKATQSTIVEVSSKPTVIPIIDEVPTKPELNLISISPSSSNFLPISTVIPNFNTVNPIPVSTQNSVSSTERVTKLFTSNFSRNRNSKWLSVTGIKDSPKSVTSKTDVVSIQSFRPQTRKFHYTTPRNKPIWMAPRRNATRISYQRPNSNPNPSTIYSEHFNVKDKYFTTQPRQSNRTMLTTVSSEIDPVLQSDVSGTKKVVHSQTISDNSIPSLWKRGSSRFRTSTATSAEVESGTSELEIPPTMTAWALASLRSPPSQPSTANATGSTQKSVDENELQKVGEVIDKNETTMSSLTTTTTTASPISNDIIPKVTDVEQNRLPVQPIYSPTSPSYEVRNEPTTEIKLERLPAESNIYVQSSAQPSTEAIKTVTKHKTKVIKPLWVPATESEKTTTEKIYDTSDIDTIPPVDGTRSTGFESITKLPADITTPQDETVAGSELNQTVTVEKPKTTTEYEITTIRFSYVPTEKNKVNTQAAVETTTESQWHPIIPTRTKATTIKDRPITTYRPTYMTTTDLIEETTTNVPETTPVIEVSSLITENVTESVRETTFAIEKVTTTEEPTTPTTTAEATEPPTTPTTTKITTHSTTTPTTTEMTIQPSTTPTTTEITTQPTTTTEMTTESTTTTKITTTTETPTTVEDVTTIIVAVVTEINTERERTTIISTPTTETETPPSELTDEDCTSEENSDNNEVITQDIKTTTTAAEPTTTTEKIKQQTDFIKETTSQHNAKIFDPTLTDDSTTESTDLGTKEINSLEDLTSYAGEVTTEASSMVLPEVAGSGAAVAIAVSTIGVIALIMLIGLLV